MCADVCPYLLLAYPPCRSYCSHFAVLPKFWAGRNLETGPANTTPTTGCPAGLALQQLTGTRVWPCWQHSTGCSQRLSRWAKPGMDLSLSHCGKGGRERKGLLLWEAGQLFNKVCSFGTLCFSRSLLCYGPTPRTVQCSRAANNWSSALGGSFVQSFRSARPSRKSQFRLQLSCQVAF